MFRNTMPRYEILSADAVAVLDRGWRRIVSEIGVQFAKPEAVELFRRAGQQVDGDVVKFDPEFVLEQVAKAPREFDVQARNPANTVHIGGDDMMPRNRAASADRPVSAPNTAIHRGFRARACSAAVTPDMTTRISLITSVVS